MTTKRNREPHGTGRTRDKGQVKYYLAVCSLSGRKTTITMESVESGERGAEKMKLKRSYAIRFEEVLMKILRRREYTHTIYALIWFS